MSIVGSDRPASNIADRIGLDPAAGKVQLTARRRVRLRLLNFSASVTLIMALALPVTIASVHGHAPAAAGPAVSALHVQDVSYRGLPFKVRPITGPHAAQVRKVIAFAKKQLGKPYRMGGASSRGWDCSGLTKKAYAAAGIKIDRSHGSIDQWQNAVASKHLYPLKNAKPGDLIFWGGKRPYHVAISLGGNLMVAATKPGDVVKVERIWGHPNKMVWRPADTPHSTPRH